MGGCLRESLRIPNAIGWRERERVELEVFGSNIAARPLYARLGFVIEGIKRWARAESIANAAENARNPPSSRCASLAPQSDDALGAPCSSDTEAISWRRIRTTKRKKSAA
jgi:hypothetical protein